MGWQLGELSDLSPVVRTCALGWKQCWFLTLCDCVNYRLVVTGRSFGTLCTPEDTKTRCLYLYFHREPSFTVTSPSSPDTCLPHVYNSSCAALTSLHGVQNKQTNKKNTAQSHVMLNPFRSPQISLRVIQMSVKDMCVTQCRNRRAETSTPQSRGRSR